MQFLHLTERALGPLNVHVRLARRSMALCRTSRCNKLLSSSSARLSRLHLQATRAAPSATNAVQVLENHGIKSPEHDNGDFKDAVSRMVNAYRTHGHKQADLDPLNLTAKDDSVELRRETYGLQKIQNSSVNFGDYLLSEAHSKQSGTVEQLEATLRSLYCGSLAIEYMHVESASERAFLASRFENREALYPVSNKRRVEACRKMLEAQELDRFLARKLATVKRYGGEGAESAIVACDELLRSAAYNDVQSVVLGAAHRGRNNMLTCLLGYPPYVYFRKMRGVSEFPSAYDAHVTGDVFSHFFTTTRLRYEFDDTDHAAFGCAGDNARPGVRELGVSMLPNPSHLDANVSSVCGKARAKRLTLLGRDVYFAPTKDDFVPAAAAGTAAAAADSAQQNAVMCFILHGDAAFAGQGVIAETFALSRTPRFTCGGTIHLIVNNQIGYTTEPRFGRSSRYTSDVCKMIGAPVLHVNADQPDEVIRAMRLATDYWRTFHSDVVIDLVCYRRWGHNELDDPSFTQPLMYNVINKRQSPPDQYAERLVQQGIVSRDEITAAVSNWRASLEADLQRAETTDPPDSYMKGRWSNMRLPRRDAITTVQTGVPIDTLKYVARQSVTVAPDFTVHSHLLKTHVQKRLQMAESGKDLDWATAEACAFGSLLLEGVDCRISGQDVSRGTFSQRHCGLTDQKTGLRYVPLNNMRDAPASVARDKQERGKLESCDSVLSEFAVLAYEYGFSLESPQCLTIWEAQFGDFFNGAQIVFDTLVTSGEAKWALQSGLVVLLPHGYDGMGPEHTSCRIERFLLLSDSSETNADSDAVNFSFANPTTPAQYFHLLRRQIVRNFRKPLIIAGPKILLRHPAAVSTLADMGPGTQFHAVLDDPVADKNRVTRVILCSGKHYYALDKHRREKKLDNVSLIRIEELSPFPSTLLYDVLSKYPAAREFIWSQEEQRNAGAWTFVQPRFANLLGITLQYRGRGPLATPATAIGHIHKREAEACVNDAFV